MYKLYRHLSFVFLLLFPQLLTARQAELLNYYPKCEYRVIGQVSYKHEVNPVKLTAGIDKLLLRLREKAYKSGAEAIVLTQRDKRQKRKIRAWEDGRTEYTQIYSYTADMLAGCDDYQTPSNTPGNYNASGGKTFKQNLGKTSIEIAVQIPAVANNKKQQIQKLPTSSEVSIAHGLYGVALGSDKSLVVDAFGQPDVTLTGSNGYQLLAYGRKHWLHFVDDKLTSIEYGKYYVNQELMNQIPHRAFFDDANWQINNQYHYKQALDNMQQPKWLEAIAQSGTYILKQQGQPIQLNFDLIKNPATDQKQFHLMGFRIGQETSGLLSNISGQIQQNSALPVLLRQALEGEIQPQTLSNIKVEQAIGMLTTEDNQQWYILDNHLAIRINNGLLDKANYYEDVFLNKAKPPASKWQLTNELQQDTEIAQTLAMLQSLPGEVMQNSYDIGFFKQGLELQLFADDDDKLNEIRFTFY